MFLQLYCQSPRSVGDIILINSELRATISMSMSMTVSPLLPNQLAQRRYSFSRCSLLPLRSDALWVLETGVVRTLTVHEEGNSVILGLWGPGDIVGRVLSQADPYQIECLTSVEATLLPSNRWDQATEAMILHIQRSEELREILHCRQTEALLIRLLAWLAKRFGRQIEQGQLIDLRLTHQDLADLVGLTRVTVTRVLNDLEQQGFIQRRRRQAIVFKDQPSFWHYKI